MNRIGSLPWSRERGGRLNLRDRVLYIGSAVKNRIARTLARRVRQSSAVSNRLDLDKLSFPQSRLVAKAFELCESVYEPWLLNHCIRTYFWGGLVGQAEEVPVDLEGLLIVSLYHDLGLVDGLQSDSDCECFAVRGARFAEKQLLESGNVELAAAATESIGMHLNVSVSPQEPVLNYLLHQGAAMDVVGWDGWKVRPLKETVLRRYPRLDFKRKLIAVLSAEAKKHPAARLALMVRFGFLDLVERAPYRE